MQKQLHVTKFPLNWNKYFSKLWSLLDKPDTNRIQIRASLGSSDHPFHLQI